jgi:endonuclease G
MKKIIKLLLLVLFMSCNLIGQQNNTISYEPKVEVGQDYYVKKNYSLVYNEEHEQASWVYYEFIREELNGTAPAKRTYRMDKDIKTKSASTSDYTRSGFDRGHLVALADMRRTSWHVYEANLMSNITPQNPSFNRGIWKKLENKVRYWVETKGTLHVICGGIVPVEYETIGKKNKIAVPTHYFKVILFEGTEGIQVISFVIPNGKSTKDIQIYSVPVDYIEMLTGIDFFNKLPDTIENNVESNVVLNNWF